VSTVLNRIAKYASAKPDLRAPDAVQQVFVRDVARASSIAVRSILRGFSRADRDDIILDAIDWFWANRGKAVFLYWTKRERWPDYKPLIALSTWFLGAIRTSRRNFLAQQSRERPVNPEILKGKQTSWGNLSWGDPVRDAEGRSAFAALWRALPSEYRRVAEMLMQGQTRAQIVATGIKQSIVDDTRARIAQLRRFNSIDAAEPQEVLRACSDPSISSDDVRRRPDRMGHLRANWSWHPTDHWQKPRLKADNTPVHLGALQNSVYRIKLPGGSERLTTRQQLVMTSPREPVRNRIDAKPPPKLDPAGMAEIRAAIRAIDAERRKIGVRLSGKTPVIEGKRWDWCVGFESRFDPSLESRS
jgi:hypothetical protein